MVFKGSLQQLRPVFVTTRGASVGYPALGLAKKTRPTGARQDGCASKLKISLQGWLSLRETMLGKPHASNLDLNICQKVEYIVTTAMLYMLEAP